MCVVAEIRLTTCSALVAEVRSLIPTDLAGTVVVEAAPGSDLGVSSRRVDLLERSTVASTCGSVRVAGCPRCAEALLGSTGEERLPSGTVTVTRGWLARWLLDGRPPVTTMDGRPVTRVVLLDTGLSSGPDGLDQLASATGCSTTVLRVGHAHLQLRVELALTQARLKMAQDAVRAARTTASASVLALEVFGQLATLTDEPAVVNGLTGLFSTLFGPRSVAFTAAPPSTPLSLLLPPESQPPRLWSAAESWERVDGGFRLRIDHGDRLLGVFELRDFAVPEAIPDYINVALSIAPTAGLAIANARAMRGIIPICGYCKKIRDEGGEWWALESYMTRHSDARFSHGVCPTCLEQQLDAEGLSR